MNNKTLVPFVATHPGEVLLDELKARGLSQKKLSEMTGLAASVINETIKGKRAGSLKMAVALEKALGVPADMWMNLQTQYNLDAANITERDNRRETVSVTIPVQDRNLLKELARKFGWACML